MATLTALQHALKGHVELTRPIRVSLAGMEKLLEKGSIPTMILRRREHDYE